MYSFIHKIALCAASLLLLASCGKDESKTELPPASTIDNITVTISDLTQSTVTVVCTPSVTTLPYYISIISKAEFEEFASDADYIQDDIEYLGNYAEYVGQDFVTFMSENTYKGAKTKGFKNLKPSTEYYAYAFGVNADSSVTSALFKTAFTTSAPQHSSNIVSFAVSQISDDSALVTTTTTTPDPYLLDFWESSKFEGLTDAQIIQKVIDTYTTAGTDMTTLCETGNTEFDLSTRLKAETKYTAIAFGFDSGVVTTNLFKKEFSTKAAGWIDCTFAVEKVSQTAYSSSYKVTPSDEGMLFYFELVPAAKFAEVGTSTATLHAYFIEQLDAQAKEWGMSLAEALPYITYKTSQTSKFNTDPSTDYYLCAIGMNSAGESICNAYISDKITTPALASAAIKFGEPTINGLTVSVSVSAEAGTATWIATGMLDFYESYTDAFLTNHLITNVLERNVTSLTITATDDTETVYFVGIGLDSTGNTGKIIKLAVPLK